MDGYTTRQVVEEIDRRMALVQGSLCHCQSFAKETSGDDFTRWRGIHIETGKATVYDFSVIRDYVRVTGFSESVGFVKAARGFSISEWDEVVGDIIRSVDDTF